MYNVQKIKRLQFLSTLESTERRPLGRVHLEASLLARCVNERVVVLVLRSRLFTGMGPLESSSLKEIVRTCSHLRQRLLDIFYQMKCLVISSLIEVIFLGLAYSSIHMNYLMRDGKKRVSSGVTFKLIFVDLRKS